MSARLLHLALPIVVTGFESKKGSSMWQFAHERYDEYSARLVSPLFSRKSKSGFVLYFYSPDFGQDFFIKPNLTSTPGNSVNTIEIIYIYFRRPEKKANIPIDTSHKKCRRSKVMP